MHRTHQDQTASCNAARYYAQKIERLVVDALRHQLSNPNLIRKYVKAYRDQRNASKPMRGEGVRVWIESSLRPKPKFSGL